MNERKEEQAKRIKWQKEGMNKVNQPVTLPLSLSLSLFPNARLHFSSVFSPRRYSAKRRQQQKEKKGGEEGARRVAESGENELGG